MEDRREVHLPKKDIRRHERIPFLGGVHISWEDARGGPKQTQARCLDVSEEGLRIEVPEPIPVQSRVSLRADRINFHGSGTVKYIARRGAKYILGLNLSHALGDQALASIRELASRKPVRTA